MCGAEARRDEGEETDNRLACVVEVDEACERGGEGRAGRKTRARKTRLDVTLQG